MGGCRQPPEEATPVKPVKSQSQHSQPFFFPSPFRLQVLKVVCGSGCHSTPDRAPSLNLDSILPLGVSPPRGPTGVGMGPRNTKVLGSL